MAKNTLYPDTDIISPLLCRLVTSADVGITEEIQVILDHMQEISAQQMGHFAQTFPDKGYKPEGFEAIVSEWFYEEYTRFLMWECKRATVAVGAYVRDELQIVDPSGLDELVKDMPIFFMLITDTEASQCDTLQLPYHQFGGVVADGIAGLIEIPMQTTIDTSSSDKEIADAAAEWEDLFCRKVMSFTIDYDAEYDLYPVECRAMKAFLRPAHQLPSEAYNYVRPDEYDDPEWDPYITSDRARKREIRKTKRFIKRRTGPFRAVFRPHSSTLISTPEEYQRGVVRDAEDKLRRLRGSGSKEVRADQATTDIR